MEKVHIEQLERAGRLLEKGLASKALSVLPKRIYLPALLRPERDFLEAEALREQGFFLKAERLYRHILAWVKTGEDPHFYAELCLNSVAGLRSLGQATQARRRLKQASSAIRSFHLYSYQGRLRLERALLDRAEGHYALSLKQLAPLLGQSLRQKSWAEAAFLLWAIAGARRFQGRLELSEQAFHRSLALAHKAKDSFGEGYAYLGLGGITRIRGRLEHSLRYYKKAARIFASGEDLFAKAYAYCGMGNALRQLGHLRQAQALYIKSHALYARLEDAVDLAYVDWGLGRIYLQKGNFREALRAFQKALQSFRRHHETRGIILAEISLAQLGHVQGKTTQAERLLTRAVNRARRSGLHAHLELFV